MNLFRRQPIAAVYQCPHNQWIIRTTGHPSENWSKTRRNWAECPGNLYQEYPSRDDAEYAVIWWGYELADASQFNRKRTADLISLILLFIGFGFFMAIIISWM